MSLIADGILILTCLTTAVYCYILSRRLTRLSNTDEGIGQQIAQLNGALEETHGAVKEIRTNSKAASEKLAREVAAARKTAKQLSRLLAESQKQVHRSYQAEPAPAMSPEAPKAKVPEVAPEKNDDLSGLPSLEDDPTLDTEELELEDDAASEQNLRDVLNEPDGAQQLGFLPDVDLVDDDSATSETLDDDEFDGLLPRRASISDDEFDDTDDPVATGNLMKVERMAL